MNLILFEEGEFDRPLPLNDPRAVHLKKVLRRKDLQEFDAGIVDGPRGKARILEETPEGWVFEFTREELLPPLYPVILAVGAGRPQTAKKILREATALGVSEIHFFGTDRGETAYLNSSIYKENNFRPYIIEGAQQAFCTRLPVVEVHPGLMEARETIISEEKMISTALDNYEAQISLKDFMSDRFKSNRPADWRISCSTVIWIGSERGWSPRERDLFRSGGITLTSMGKRVLRTETAAVTAAAICLAEMGFLE